MFELMVIKNKFIESFILNYQQNRLAMVILLIFLIYNTFTDIKYFKIYNYSNLILVITRFILPMIPIFRSYEINLNNIFGAVFSLLVVLIPAVIFLYKMGGDIKLFTAIGFFLGIYIMPVFIAITLISSLLYGLTQKYLGRNYKKIPLAPFFLISHIILMLLSYII